MSAVIYVAVWSGDLKCIHNLLYLAGSANVSCYHSVIQYSFAAYECLWLPSLPFTFNRETGIVELIRIDEKVPSASASFYEQQVSGICDAFEKFCFVISQ